MNEFSAEHRINENINLLATEHKKNAAGVYKFLSGKGFFVDSQGAIDYVAVDDYCLQWVISQPDINPLIGDINSRFVYKTIQERFAKFGKDTCRYFRAKKHMKYPVKSSSEYKK